MAAAARPSPEESLPPALRPEGGDDFTQQSMKVRVPGILRGIAAKQPAKLSQAQLGVIEGLAASIESNGLIDLPAGELEDYAEEGCGGDATWHTAPWWSTENLTYELLLRGLKAAGFEGDPFAPHKREALESAKATLAASVVPLLREAFAAPKQPAPVLQRLLLRSLWGNRQDLSLSGGEVDHEHLSGQVQTLLLRDDSELVADRLATLAARTGKPATVGFWLDNCGLELVCDLALAAGLLRVGAAAGLSVTFFAKPQPVFVSDAMPADVRQHIDWLAARATELGGAAQPLSDAVAELRGALDSGRFSVQQHDHFVGPRPAWKMPAELRERVAACDVVLVKGDANYRRLLGDRAWPFDTPFEEVLAYFPTSVVALRTAKSAVMSGVPAGVQAEARKVFADRGKDAWLVTGVCGLVQARLLEE